MTTESNFPIDLVYLWCDFDPKRHKEEDRPFVQSNDELKYSLRSVEQYAPFINNIFIVTNGEKPSWLDTSKVTMVTHSEIMPKELLDPKYANSCGIFPFLSNIKNLSEHFIFSSDDMFFGKQTKPSNWFREDGRPIIRMYPTKYQYDEHSTYEKNLKNALDLVGLDETFKMWHGMDAATKSTHKLVQEKFYDNIMSTITPRREEKNIEPNLLYLAYMMKNNLGDYINVKGYYKFIMWEYPYLKVPLDTFLTFCINASDTQFTEENRQDMINKMELLFPIKSKYEL